MSIFSTAKIKSSIQARSKIDLSHSHMTTLDFGQLVPIHVMENIIGDKVNVKLNAFSRMAPMVFPTFGDVGLRMISAYCPYYLIADDADSYLSGLSEFRGRSTNGRTLDVNTILRYILQDAYNPVFTSDYAIHNYKGDYIRTATPDEVEYISNIDSAIDNVPRDYISVSQFTADSERRLVQNWYKLTYKGKYVYKVLRCLGYDIPQSMEFDDNSLDPYEAIPQHVMGQLKFNAYPILCYAKIYADLMLPTAFYNNSDLLRCLQAIKGDDGYFSHSGEIDIQGLTILLDNVQKVYYDSDYFTTAWQSPISPLSTIQVVDDIPSIGQYDIDGIAGSSVLQNSNNGVGLRQNSSNNVNGFTQTQLNFLRAFDKFVRKNNLVGYREYNSVYARFGIKPSEMKSNYVQILDIRNTPVSVGDVTSTSQTDQALLGSYAGKGFLNNDNSISFKCDDFGMYIQMVHLYVKPTYYQGIRKHALKTSPYDFYQPEFDGVGPDPISQMEINSQVQDLTFGFTERYNDYRFALDNITGDFAIDPQMAPWHTGRYFINNPDYLPVAQSDDMLTYGADSFGNQEYDRIFATENVNNPYDHFYMIFNFNVKAQRNIKNISQALDLGDGEIKLDRNGSV